MGFITEFLDPLKRGGPEGLGFRGSMGGSRGVQGVQRVHGGPGGGPNGVQRVQRVQQEGSRVQAWTPLLGVYENSGLTGGP